MWRWTSISEGIRFDGHTLVVRIPIRFQRRGGRKRIVAPDGCEIVPTSKPQPDGTRVKVMARAWRWWRLLGDRDLRTGEINRGYVSRRLPLALLPPNIVEAILAGATD